MSTSTGTDSTTNGTRPRVNTAAAHVVQRWIVTLRAPTSHCWVSTSTNRTTIGWSSFSNMKGSASGQKKSTPSCKVHVRPGLKVVSIHTQQRPAVTTFITT